MKRIMRLMLVLLSLAIGATSAEALSSYVTTFKAAYPAAASSALASCVLCHINPGGGGTRNAYGNAFLAAGHSYTAIASADSDGDGYTNIAEITALTFPGDATSHPTAADTTAPTVTGFTVPATSATLNVAVTLFTASDDVAVTGYIITESATKPASGAAGWSATAPVTYPAATVGAKTLYAYAKDAAGNVSTGKSANVTVTNGVVASNKSDFNGDGKADILLQNKNNGQIAIWLMSGSTFVSDTVLTKLSNAATGWNIVGTGDFNGDGQTDILLQNTNNGSVAIWFMNGSTFVSDTILSKVSDVAAGWKIVGTGDFNGNGQTDILLQNTNNGMVAIWFMSGSTFVSDTILSKVSNVAAGWNVVGTADYNGDGQTDILLQNTNNGMVAIWFMNGSTFMSDAVLPQASNVSAGWNIVGPQ